MGQEKISMRKFREALRLHLKCGLSNRQIGRTIQISNSTVGHYIKALKQSGLTWAEVEALGDEALENRVALHCEQIKLSRPKKIAIDYVKVHQDLKMKGVTREILWEEYRGSSDLPIISYTQFCFHYRAFLKRQKPSMRQIHKAGEKMFVDYAGPTVPIKNATTGDIAKAVIFVGVLGASNYTYAEATLTRSLPDWIGSHIRMFDFFGGVTQLVIPDNEKSGVNRACYYDPELNPQYAALAAHYDTVVLPTRPAKPKDKAKVEVAVQIVERWILARLRYHTFFSLDELNKSIFKLLADLNNRPFKKLPGTRTSQFNLLDQPALKKLPEHAYEYVDIKRCQVRLDYHIEVDSHYYSVPHRFICQPVEYHLGTSMLEVFSKGLRIASHIRSYEKGKATTISEHMPKSHLNYQAWSPQKFVDWAAEIGPSMSGITNKLINERPHPECCHRTHLGFMRLAKRYSKPRLEQACHYALQKNLHSYTRVKSVLETQIDKTPHKAINEKEFNKTTSTHSNVRGGAYYLHKKT